MSCRGLGTPLLDEPQRGERGLRLAAFFALLCLSATGCGKKTTVGASCADAGAASRSNGQSCTCSSECESGFCVDGLCCDTACGGSCQACNLVASPGTCSFVPSGQLPREESDCKRADKATCGLDGTCDGKGSCRRYEAGAVCQAGKCNGAAVDSIDVCDGEGLCKPGPATICAPFNCDVANNKCFPTCKSDLDCVSGRKCVDGSCGKKPQAAVCSSDIDCASGFCADGVCCNVACDGPCQSCGLVGHEGICLPVAQGRADPHGICSAVPVSMCGPTGNCDGVGGCELYARETICGDPVCAGDILNTVRTCDGLGVCRDPGVLRCDPYRCRSGACLTTCTADTDCQAGRFCVNGSCGLKPVGQACTGASQCQSNFCVDGYCCEDGCMGACRSCGLASSRGRCTLIGFGTADPHAVCADQGPATCGTDGRCDGLGGCRRYVTGTVCASERCLSNVYTPPATCNGSGMCLTPATLPCSPYVCNGTKCFTACTTDANCISPRVCNVNMCGKKANGIACSSADECQSNFCAQGVCCDTACNTHCKSCALAATRGACTNVAPGGADPASPPCANQGQTSCGTNGRCEGGACQRYAANLQCAPPTCPLGMAMATSARTCDGLGGCRPAVTTQCTPFACNGVSCNATCMTNADCSAGNICLGNVCGKRALGQPCGGDTECASAHCVMGICCGATCPAAPPCGFTGACTAAGTCAVAGTNIMCGTQTCVGTTFTPVGNCSGGLCRQTPTNCGQFRCGTNGSCLMSCMADANCIMGDFCLAGACVPQKAAGAACAANNECMSAHCVDGVCCASELCPTCNSCAVPGSLGRCAPTPGVVCMRPSCPAPGTILTPASTCSIAGLCVPGTVDGAATVDCTPFACNGTSACTTMCTAPNVGCAPGALCIAGACVALLPPSTPQSPALDP